MTQQSFKDDMLSWRSGNADAAKALVKEMHSGWPWTALVLHTIWGTLSCFSWLSWLSCFSWLSSLLWFSSSYIAQYRVLADIVGNTVLPFFKPVKKKILLVMMRRRAWLRLIIWYGWSISGGGPGREGEENWAREHRGWGGGRDAPHRAVIYFLRFSKTFLRVVLLFGSTRIRYES